MTPARHLTFHGRRLHAARRGLAGLLLVGLTAVAALMAAAPLAAAVAVGGPQPFGLTPALTRSGQPRPYFAYNLAAGASTTDTAVIANAGTRPLRLDVSASTGVTAPNSGSAFTDAFQPCRGTSCWVSGLPASVRLKAGERKNLRFRVHVPAGTRPRQYLAGITVQPAGRTRSVRVGANGHSSARAIIVHQITVGVAVTVGRRSHLTTRLAVRAVTAGYVGTLPRVEVRLANTGQTFTHGRGTLSCTNQSGAGPFPVVAQTILPRGAAAIPVNVPGLPAGRPLPCRLRLRYGRRLLTWSGTLTLPRTHQHPATVHVGPGAYSPLPSRGLPAWAIALFAALGAALLALAGVSVHLFRQHQQS